METQLDRIRKHLTVLNHSSERMANSLNDMDSELSELSQRVAAIEANMGWLMRLIWVVLGGIVMIVFRVFAN
jgi:predicted  nucleic acid-binding Zn-ribbon protein